MSFAAPHHVVIKFDGADAASFLQSQLTNDIDALAVGQWQWQGYCSAKGRLHATFALSRTDTQTFLAVVHESVSEFLVKRLSMFRLRSKLTIAIQPELVAAHHFVKPSTSEHTVALFDLQNGRWVEVVSRNTQQLPAPSPAEMEKWNELGILSKQPEIIAATNEHFVPQMIGFDKTVPNGGVSFSKGCYPGQEVVARAHYRGAVKREPVVAVFEQDMLLQPGQDIELSDGRIAEVVNATRNGAKSVVLAVASIQPASGVAENPPNP
jgi:tRNA-modifying protein YgfZ